MFSRIGIFALPTRLLALLAITPHRIQGEELRWPYNLPSYIKYYPEEEAIVRRDESILQRLQWHPVVGVKKMSDDEGEKFYLDYWSFAPIGSDDTLEYPGFGRGENGEEERHSLTDNDTAIERAIPPLLLHSAEDSGIASKALSQYIRFLILPRFLLKKRAFQCPTGTSSCGSINRPASCCTEGQTCQIIQDTGLGDVGCCAAGETCAGSLSNCEAGYTSCPDFPGGGCCIPGYTCVSGGCLLSSTATVIVTPSTPPFTSQSVTQSLITTTVVASSPSSSAVVSLPTTSATTPPPTSQNPSGTSTITISTSTGPNTLLCSSGFRSCPASLGGGCCPTSRACGRDVCPLLSSTVTVGAPVRPTSDDATPTTTSDGSIAGCPTGFYACSAFYQGGCCRLGRECAPTSCPTSVNTTLIDNNGVTIIATASSGLTANSILTGACATGWSSCAAGDGGGCCPTGYVCGPSCTATATVSGLQASEVAKLAPNGAVGDIARDVMVYGVGTALMSAVFLAA